MNRTQKTTYGIIGVAIAALVAVAAVPATISAIAPATTGAVDAVTPPSSRSSSPTSPPTAAAAADTSAQYDAQRANYALPDGYEWPENGEDTRQTGFSSPASEIQMLWACVRLDAAWAAIDAGDRVEADRLVAPVYETSIWTSDPPTFGTGSNARDWGWHGICTQQLGLRDYPVRGLYNWSPSSEVEPASDGAGCGEDGYGVDSGRISMATGSVVNDADGRPIAYIVAAGDAPQAIEKRLCITNLMERNGLNRYIQPGEQLTIDPTVPIP